MTATQKFIEDAIKGGWYPVDCDADAEMNSQYGMTAVWHRGDGEIDTQHLYPIHEILLSPLAWQAVGKTRGHKYPRDMMLSFMTNIADGLTIEEALSKIQN